MAEQIDIISQNTQSTVIAEFERQDKGTAEMIYTVIDTNVFVAALCQINLRKSWNFQKNSLTLHREVTMRALRKTK